MNHFRFKALYILKKKLYRIIGQDFLFYDETGNVIMPTIVNEKNRICLESKTKYSIDNSQVSLVQVSNIPK